MVRPHCNRAHQGGGGGARQGRPTTATATAHNRARAYHGTQGCMQYGGVALLGLARCCLLGLHHGCLHQGATTGACQRQQK